MSGIVSSVEDFISDPFGTKAAAQSQANATDYAANLQYQMFQQYMNQPMQQALQQQGPQALNQLMSTYAQPNAGFGMQQFQQSPLYQTMQQQQSLGMNQLAAQGAAGGMYGSGNLATAAQNYGAQVAGTYEPAAYQQWMGGLNALQSVAGLGQTNLGQTGQAGQNYANSAGNLAVTGANYLAQGDVQSKIAQWNLGMGALGYLYG